MPFVAGRGRPVKQERPGPRGEIKPTKGQFNHFPAIIAAFPGALDAIVHETTEELANVAQALAPTLQHQRKGDPAPGNLKASKRTRYYRKRATGMVQTGRVDFGALDPRGHRYPKPLETGSTRRTKRGYIHVTKGSGWLVDAIVAERRAFRRKLDSLEARLPH